MMKKLAFLFLIVLIFETNSFSQGRNAVGLRISSNYDLGDLGLTFKHRFKVNTTIEGIANFNNSFSSITGLLEKYKSLTSTTRLQFLYGGGAYVGFGGATRAGIAGILGLCYNFKDIPFDLSIDWMPTCQIVNDVHPYFNSLGLSIRFKF